MRYIPTPHITLIYFCKISHILLYVDFLPLLYTRMATNNHYFLAFYNWIFFTQAAYMYKI